MLLATSMCYSIVKLDDYNVSRPHAQSGGARPILPDSAALVVDEAHKLPETLRQTLELSLEAEDVRDLIRMLRDEEFKKEADGLSSFSGRLLEALDKPPQEIPFEQYARLLFFPGKVAETIYQRQKYSHPT